MWRVYSDIALNVMTNIVVRTSITEDKNLEEFILITLDDSVACGMAAATLEKMLVAKERRKMLGNYARDDYWTSDNVIASANKEFDELKKNLLARINIIEHPLINAEQKQFIIDGIAYCFDEGYRICRRQYRIVS